MGDPVPSSGMISLNDFHIAAGGTAVSGTACNLNEADIRGLISKGSGAAMNFGEWYGASSVVHSTSMVAGYSAQQYVTISGYGTSVAGDSLGDDSIDSICGQSGVTITGLQNVNNNFTFALSKSGATFSNSGWTTMKVWVGQNNNSGTPTATFPRTGTGSYHSGSVSFQSSTGSCSYFYQFVAFANAFGSTHQGNCFIEIV